ncbi:uncharacterized protein [Pleurodeles waltl]|uniref:uncharacterized protein n=1 Tax=Pleurodeles waltl TaxID=8319 RepID=UPI00370981E1
MGSRAHGRVFVPRGGSPSQEEEGSSEEGEVVGQQLGESQGIERGLFPGTPDLFELGPLDFDGDDSGEHGAALLPWEEEKGSPRAANRMTSKGRRGRRGRAADAFSRLCGGVGDTPPGTAAWEEQRLGSIKTWGYDSDYAGGARGCGKSGKGVLKGLDGGDRMSDVSLEEGELRNSGSESEWWERSGRGVANPVRKSSQVSRRLKASQEAGRGEQRKVQERPPLLSPGVVLGPEAEFLELWVIGHSFIKWAQRQAQRTSIGDNLGLDSSRYRIKWIGKGGMLWEELLPRLQSLRGRAHCLDVLLIHLGENDLVRTTGLNLLKRMKGDLQVLLEQWRGCHVVFTAFVPHRVWRGARKPGAIERARRKLNKEMKGFCVGRGVTFLEHLDLKFEDAEFFRDDGVHLSFIGMELYLLQVKEQLKQLFKEP